MATDVENVKARSANLRGTVVDELADGSSPFSSDAGHLLKFHGIYQQDDRDQRRERTRSKRGLAYSCMVRCSVPGGVLRSDQWLEIDRLADEVADGTLRLTSRQGVQYHFVTKTDLPTLVGSLNRGLVTTYAACGDVVRNVMVSSTPSEGRDLERLDSLGRALANRFRPHSAAYWELWLDGERAVSSGPTAVAGQLNPRVRSESNVEPIYGDQYLPRKFKVGIAWPGDSSIDVFSQDLGFVLVDGPLGAKGAVVLAGGGLGRSHGDASTFPRLADRVAWVADDEIPEIAEAVVAIFRDEGNRNDRAHARIKYLIAERGVEWLRAEVEHRLGRRLADPVALPDWGGARDHLGWHRQASRPGLPDSDGQWYLGLPVPSGRLTDTEQLRRRSAVRAVVQRFAKEVRLTPHQDLLLCGIAGRDRPAVDNLLASFGVPQAKDLPLTVLSSMACPALPTCGQALGEAERVLPEVTDLIDGLLGQRGLETTPIEMRMTGCPNGCSRPYVAELGIVARTKTAYDIFVGGDPAGTRIASLLVEAVPLAKLGHVLAPLLDRYRIERNSVDDEGSESFGDWSDRIGVEELAVGLPDFSRSGGRP